MNRTETATLVERIVGTWSNGPKGFVWTETFDDHPQFDSATAGKAYRALRDGGLGPNERITVARFLVEYRIQSADGPDDANVPPAYCVLCDGCGWVSAPPERAHNPRHCRPTPERPCMCTASEPCQCSAAKARDAEGVRRRIVEHSDRHRTHHGDAPGPPEPPAPASYETERLDLS